MLAEKTLDQPIYVEMRLVDQADKLERLLLSEEEIAALEKLGMSGEFDSETTQRWFANCRGGGGGHCRHGCGGCGGCSGCGGCGHCRHCRHSRHGCGGCGVDDGTVSGVMGDTDELGFGY